NPLEASQLPAGGHVPHLLRAAAGEGQAAIGRKYNGLDQLFGPGEGLRHFASLQVPQLQHLGVAYKGETGVGRKRDSSEYAGAPFVGMHLLAGGDLPLFYEAPVAAGEARVGETAIRRKRDGDTVAPQNNSLLGISAEAAQILAGGSLP